MRTLLSQRFMIPFLVGKSGFVFVPAFWGEEIFFFLVKENVKP